MCALPVLCTARLVLRPFAAADADAVQRLAGDRAISDTTLNIPYPYEPAMAEGWIAGQPEAWERGEIAVFAVTTLADGLVGAVSLRFEPPHRRAELGYWIGRPFWRRGYGTEAARAVVDWGFDALDLNRIHAAHLVRNPPSGRIMQKLGMRYEGRFREHVLKDGVFEDLEKYAILRRDRRR